MARFAGNVHLVGSVPLDSAGQVFETCARALGPHLGSLPDGEVGHRIHWIVCQAVFVFNNHPDIELVHRPAPRDGKEQWLPRDNQDQWKFRLKSPTGAVQFDNLKYADWAIESYAVFKALRERGIIPRSTRFQVCMPTPLAGFMSFFSPEDGVCIHKAYEAAMLREVEKMCGAIPHDDLAIQWDVAVETTMIERGQAARIGGDMFDRWVEEVSAMGPAVPPGVALGYHICYGDFNHRHAVEPKDLSVAVRMLNEAASRANRPLDFVHLPVPINRNDDAYFAPLRDLRVDDARVFLGLIHYDDGIAGTQARIKTAKQHLADFGIATECGFGRRRPETLTELLRIHREVADHLTG
ncbi:MAG TPA: hypothetical protein VHY80_03165 [Stellaceae bacterium]|nr:hypothetical protein [Stellaceae bacterium]